MKATVTLSDMPAPERVITLRLIASLKWTPEAERFRRWFNSRRGVAARAATAERHAVAWLNDLLALYRQKARRR